MSQNQKIFDKYKDMLIKEGIVKKAPGKDPTPEYLKTLKDLNSQLENLKSKLKGHQKAQKKDPQNWGYVGDLKHLSTQLDEILAHLKG